MQSLETVGSSGRSTMLGKLFLCQGADTSGEDTVIINPILSHFVSSLPSQSSFTLVGCIMIEDEKKTEYDVVINLKDEVGSIVKRIDGTIFGDGNNPETEPWKTAIVFNIGIKDLPIESEGLHTFEVFVNRKYVDETKFYVILENDNDKMS